MQSTDPSVVFAIKAFTSRNTNRNTKISTLASALIDVHNCTGCLDNTRLRDSHLLRSAHESSTALKAAHDFIRGIIHSMSATHESSIMIQHGYFDAYYKDEVDEEGHVIKQHCPVTVKSPPCRRGSNCIGMVGQFDGFTKEVPGIVLMAYIHQRELDELRKTGRRPRDWAARACVLCVRYAMNRLLICQMTIGTGMPPGIIAQPWHSPAGSRGTYRLDCVWGPSTETSTHGDGVSATTNGLVSVFPKFLGTHLMAIKPQASSHGLWAISQKSMIIPSD